MRALIVSDTHGYDGNLYEVLRRVGRIDLLLHAGDASGSEDMLEKAAGCKTLVVNGNNDYSPALKYEEEIDFAGHHILLTHGHRYGVYYGPDKLFYKALECGADVVVYGHTHIPSVEYDEETGVVAVNPGSLSFPRQDDRKPTYVLMESDANGELHFTIKNV